MLSSIPTPFGIPDRHWSAMGPDRQALLYPTDSRLEFLFPTGSRIICPNHCRQDSDWDFFGYATGHSEDYPDKLAFGWQEDDRFSESREKYGSDGDFTLYTNEELNMHLILFFAFGRFQAFMDATNFCRSIEGPVDRPSRVKVFQRFLKNVDKFDEDIPF